jgi:signal transduction histidine kinase
MRRRRLPLGLFIPIGLALLVALLAVLQYRWLGQVSTAERERMKATLMQRAEAFAKDFDREVLNLYLALQAESLGLAQHDWASFGRRYDTWHDSAEYPQIVTAVYFIEGEDAQRTLWRYQPHTHAFEPAEWPAELAPIRDRIRDHDRLATGSSPGQARTFIMMRDPIVASIPALLVALPVVQPLPAPDSNAKFSLRIGSRFVLAQLDRAYLESTMLPAIAGRHFPGRDATDYRFAVVEAGRSGSTVFSHGVAKGAALNPEKADVVVPFFTLRPDLSNQVTAKAMMMHATPPFDVMTGPPPPPPPAPAAVWFGRGTTTTRSESGRTAPTTAQGTGAAMIGRSGTMSIVVEQRGATVTDYRVSQTLGVPAWQLVVQHTAGSLDEAVARARRRNLWLSFGILAVLGSGVGLVVLNARRSERLAAQQMDFVATVSHELRTPLAVIRSAAQNLSAGVVNDANQARQYGDLIEEEGRRLTDMVEQVLAYAGMSDARGLVSARPADISAIVRDVLSAASPLVASAGFEETVEIAADLPAVSVDESAVRRALHNLITNALKYGADGKWLGVSVRRVAAKGGHSGDEVRVAVSDRGRGIDPQDLPHIFEPFYRGRSAIDRQIHGNGLGLSLVKRIADAHGGLVTVRSTPGEGATFTLHLPVADVGRDLSPADNAVPADVGRGFSPAERP